MESDASLVVCNAPAEVNQLSEQVLRDRALTLMAHKDSHNLPSFPPLAGVVTNRLLERVTSIVWSLSSSELSQWSKQRALARVIASISGGRLPGWVDAEQPGNRMLEFVGRYREKRKKLLCAEKAAMYRARRAGKAQPDTCATESLVVIDETLYHCKYGCTPPVMSYRRSAPGNRAQPTEYELCSFAKENLELCRANARLRRLETEAVEMLEAKLSVYKMDLANSVTTEHHALILIDEQTDRTRRAEVKLEDLSSAVKAVQRDNKGMQMALQKKEKEVAVLGGKVARAHMDLLVEQRASEQRKRKLEATCEKQRQADLELVESLRLHNSKLKEESAKREALYKSHEAMCLRLGSHVARLNFDLAELQQEFDKSRNALLKQKSIVENELEGERLKTERLRALKNQMARKKRAAEGRALTSERRLERAQTAEETLLELQEEYDQLHIEMETSAERAQNEHAAVHFEVSGEHGHFGVYSWRLRLLIYKWLLRRTPPSAIGANIVDAAQFLCPGIQVRVPGISMVRKMRQEATLIGEAISAFRIATAKRVVSFGFDETTKMGDGLASINLQIETMDGEVCDEILRAAFLIPGGCADQISSAIETKVFSRARKLLMTWQQIYEEKHGQDSWPGPKPSQLGYHRLAQSLIMSDTCNGARAAKRMIIDRAAAEVEAIARQAGTWDAMDENDKQKATTSYVGDCMQHIRNILIDAMAAAATSMLKYELQESLEAFSAYERMSTDPMQLIRAAYKEFHHEGEYAKGKGKEFEHWRRTRHPSTFFMPFERARGGRQDLAFDGAVPLFANRVLASTFLREQVFTPNHSNVLEDFLWNTLSCVEMVALTRVLTLWDLLLSLPLRWLCGSSSRLSNWSIYDFGPVLDSVVTLLENVASDGTVLLGKELSPFSAVADKQPLFKRWLEGLHEDEIRAPDGKTTFCWYPLVLEEAREPKNKSNQEATDMVIQLAMTMATHGLKKMKDPRAAIKDWISCTDGKYSSNRVTEEARLATIGAHATNDRVESNFGGYDAVIRQFRTISIDAAAGMAQQMRLHHLDSRSKHIVSDRRKAKTASREEDNCQSSSVGFFENCLSDELQASCVEMGRQLRVEARKWERSDRLEQAEYREMKRAQNLLLQVDSLAEKGAIAIERFNAYEGRAARTWQEALCVLDTMQQSHAAQLSYLREQIELRSLGLGWSDLEISWKQGGESAAQSVVRVREHFRQNVLRVEAQRRRDGLIPSEPPVPDFKAKSLKQLGMPTSDSTELASKALCSPEQMQAAIEREQQRRAEAGFSDAVQALQPKEAPHLDDAMVGKQLEICWNYISTEDNKTKVPIWCPCTVMKIADGMTDRGRDGQLLSDRAKKLAPRGMVLVEWEPDPVRGEAEATQAWYLLDPNKWQGRQTERDKDTHRAWRYHPQQLVKEQNAARQGADKTLPTQRR